MNVLLDASFAGHQSNDLLHARLGQRQQLFVTGPALQAEEQAITDYTRWAAVDQALESPRYRRLN